jgi:hypothetical protein
MSSLNGWENSRRDGRHPKPCPKADITYTVQTIYDQGTTNLPNRRRVDLLGGSRRAWRASSPATFLSLGWATATLRAERASARTECPASRAAFTVSRPIPLLAPMIRTVATAHAPGRPAWLVVMCAAGSCAARWAGGLTSKMQTGDHGQPQRSGRWGHHFGGRLLLNGRRRD